MLSRVSQLRIRKMAKQTANDFLNFVNNSPSPYHAVEQTRQMLLKANYREISEVGIVSQRKNN